MRAIIVSAALLLVGLATGCTPTTPTEVPRGGTMPPDLARLFARLQEPRFESNEPARLVLRDGPEVPEPTRVEMPFPPTEHPDAGPPERTAASPLRVLSYAPRGSDELIGAVRVTFSQPMIPVAELSQVRAQNVPVRISPLPPGRFRWLGVTTVAFEPAGGRMPLATEYVVEVPAGTRSTLGGALGQSVRFTFDTPPPKVIESTPSNGEQGVELEPIVVLHFNQRVDPNVVLASTSLEGTPGARLSILTGRELSEARSRSPQLQAWEEDRVAVLKITPSLRKATAHTLRIAAGLRGAEGPRPMPEAERISFQTYEPLRLVSVGCGGEQCRPGNGVMVEFNNPIVAEDLAELVRVTPTVPRLQVEQYGTTVALNGDFQAATRYEVSVRGAITDNHGQRLGADQTRTVRFGDAWPYARLAAENFATLELDSERLIPIEIMNTPRVGARVAAVPREKLGVAIQAIQEGWGWDRSQDPFTRAGLRAAPAALRTGSRRNVEDRVGIPIANAIAPQASGYALVELTVPNSDEPQNRNAEQRTLALVQATDLGVVASVDAFEGIVRVSSLSSGTPVAGARVRIMAATQNRLLAEGTTDAHGMMRGRLNLETGSSDQVRIVATKGNDEAFVHLYASGVSQDVVGEIFTDRDPYRPGDTVRIRVVAKMRMPSPAAPIAPLPQGSRVRCSVRDVRWQERHTFDEPFSAYGTASASFRIPKDAALGEWNIQCQLDRLPSGLGGRFRVEEYRAPEIEVNVHAPEGTHYQGETKTFVIESKYLFGAPAANLPVRYTIGRERTQYEPPGHPGYAFGDASQWPWLPIAMHGGGIMSRRGGRIMPPWGGAQRDIIKSGEGTLDENGRLQVPVELAPGEVEGPVKFVLEAEVTDPSRQSVAGREEVLAHPASVYVGLRAEKTFVPENDPIRVRGIVVDVAGAARNGASFIVRAVERRSKLVTRRVGNTYAFDWEEEEREVGRCELASTSEGTDCRIAPQRPGRYILEATTVDSERRTTKTKIAVHVFGGGWVPWNGETEQLELIPDKQKYQAGETARILVRAPFSRGLGLLSIERSGAMETRAIALDGSVQMFEVPITTGHVPQVQVRVSVARGRASREELAQMLQNAGPDAMRAAAEDIGRPIFGTGLATLTVDDAPKRLRVDVTPEHRVRAPGEELGVSVRVRNPNGRPADAEVTVMVVDEGVLSLLGYETPDLVDGFHQAVGSSVNVDAVHAHVIRRRKTRALEEQERSMAANGGAVRRMRVAATGYGAGGGGRAAPAAPPEAQPMQESVAQDAATTRGPEIPATARTLFATTAFYTSSLRTDRNGVAQLRFRLPDNLTKFRIMAVAVAKDDKAGSGESQVEVRKSVLLRPALPRFATFGDRFEATVVVHNETGRDADITVGMRAAGIVPTGSQVKRVRLRNGAAQRVAFPVRVDAGGGKARVQFAAAAEGGADAVELDLPLAEPATSEAFATYGSVTEGVVRVPVEAPRDVIDRWGRLELTLSSTALTNLNDATDYLFDYPYACAEQHASRLLAAGALRSVMEGRDEKSRERAARLAAESIAALQRLQRDDGGFVYWPGSPEPELYTSAWVTFALSEAKRGGMSVPEDLLRRAYGFLQARLENPSPRYGEDRAFAMQALALFTLTEAEQTISPEHINRVWRKRSELPLFAKAWLFAALRSRNPDEPRANELWRQIENAAVETPSGAHFAEDRVESARLLWHSERRTDAIVLAAMLKRDATHPLVEKTARALMAARRNGAWHTTQENAWALVGLARYYRIAERTVPDMEVRAWLGNTFVAEHEFRGRTGRIAEGSVPMSALREIGSGDFVVAPEGAGRLYYRIGLRYAKAGDRLPPEEQGFAVTRTYEAIEQPSDVQYTNGTWRIRAESNVRVRLTLVIPDDRYDVALDDPLPAGLEPVHMGFETTASQRLEGSLDDRVEDTHDNYIAWCWPIFAFDHRELRDDRVVAFARHAAAGVYELTYIARATTPGEFVASPTKAEEMYAPEVFGRTASDVVIVRE